MVCSILLVDDDTNATAALKTVFELEGYSVLTAANGELAWKTLKRWRPDLIVTDLNMPIMDGLQLCRKLETTKPFMDIPIILASSAPCPRRYDRVLTYLHKPFTIERLLAVVRTLLGRSPREQLQTHRA